MNRLAVIAFLALLCACSRSPPMPQYANREDDPMYQEIKRIVEAVSNCYRREAESPSVRNVDIDTAALAVFGRCAAERQRHKAYSVSHTIESIPQFEMRWRMEEQSDLLHIKQMLAVIRTGR
jgi:hypothetical protein